MLLTHVYKCFAYMYFCPLWRPAEGIKAPDPGVTDGCELTCGS